MNFASTVESPTAQCITRVHLPSTALVREATEFVRDIEPLLMFNHSSRVFCFAAFSGIKRGLAFDPELLYVGAMFHDIGLFPKHSSPSDRFEDVLADKDPQFKRINFCSIIRGSPGKGSDSAERVMSFCT